MHVTPTCKDLLKASVVRITLINGTSSFEIRSKPNCSDIVDDNFLMTEGIHPHKMEQYNDNKLNTAIFKQYLKSASSYGENKLTIIEEDSPNYTNLFFKFMTQLGLYEHIPAWIHTAAMPNLKDIYVKKTKNHMPQNYEELAIALGQTTRQCWWDGIAKVRRLQQVYNKLQEL